mgnify:CR=1 FL=1
MALSEAAIKRNKKRRNSANSETMTLSELELERRLQEEHDKFDPAKKEKRTSKRKNLLGWTGLRANTPPKENKVDKKSKENTTSKRTSNGTGLRANVPSKENKKKDKGKPTKYKMVTAPHRNPTNKKVKVVDRPGKPRKKIMVNPGRGFKGGGKIYSVDNSGQNLVQKMYGGKIQN